MGENTFGVLNYSTLHRSTRTICIVRATVLPEAIIRDYAENKGKSSISTILIRFPEGFSGGILIDPFRGKWAFMVVT